jgi:hypothetical protein
MQSVWGATVPEGSLEKASQQILHSLEDLFEHYCEQGQGIPEKQRLLEDFCQCVGFMPNGSLVVRRRDGCKIVKGRDFKKEFQQLGAMVYFDASPITVSVEQFVKQNRDKIPIVGV